MSNYSTSFKKWNKLKTSIIIIRINKTGNLLMSKPCSRCFNLIKKSKFIKNIIYSNENGYIEKVKVCDFSTNHISKFYKSI